MRKRGKNRALELDGGEEDNRRHSDVTSQYVKMVLLRVWDIVSWTPI